MLARPEQFDFPKYVLKQLKKNPVAKLCKTTLKNENTFCTAPCYFEIK